jgi:hypothetical protein
MLCESYVLSHADDSNVSNLQSTPLALLFTVCMSQCLHDARRIDSVECNHQMTTSSFFLRFQVATDSQLQQMVPGRKQGYMRTMRLASVCLALLSSRCQLEEGFRYSKEHWRCCRRFSPVMPLALRCTTPHRGSTLIVWATYAMIYNM